MNGNLYQNPTFPTNSIPINNSDNLFMEKTKTNPNEITIIEDNNYNNLYKLNKGKRINIYTTINNQEKIFNGILEDSTKDYIIISEPSSSNWYIIKEKYINYIEFIEKLNIN